MGMGDKDHLLGSDESRKCDWEKGLASWGGEAGVSTWKGL